jgi:AcrR family transcriptional regulator
MPLSDLLAQRRPHRADAARNFDAIITSARAGFTDIGTEASLADIARRAGVGSGTLYRHFPTREDLIATVYVADVDRLCEHALQLTEAEESWPAFVAWIRNFASYMAKQRVLLDALDRGSSSLSAFRQALYDYSGPLLTRAQDAGYANRDMSIDDVMRLVIGVTSFPFESDHQRERILDIAIAGIATRQAAAVLTKRDCSYYGARIRDDPAQPIRPVLRRT